MRPSPGRLTRARPTNRSNRAFAIGAHRFIALTPLGAIQTESIDDVGPRLKADLRLMCDAARRQRLGVRRASADDRAPLCDGHRAADHAPLH